MRFVSIDPGESTGYAVWEDPQLGQPPLYAGTADLWDFIEAVSAAAGIHEAISHTPIARSRVYAVDRELERRLGAWDRLVIEDWALYPWKLDELAWDKCRTARGIGALEFIARLAGKPCVLQPAAIKDQAESAGAPELFLRPLHENRHANDAIRHGVVYQLMQLAGPAEPSKAAPVA